MEIEELHGNAMLNYKGGYNKAIDDVEKLLDICKVCGSSHGKWLDRDEFYKKLKGLKRMLSTERKSK